MKTEFDMRVHNIDKMNEKISGLLDYVKNPNRKSAIKEPRDRKTT